MLLAITMGSGVLFAQKVEVNEIDDFTGVRNIGVGVFRPQKEKMLKPLVVIGFCSSNNIAMMHWYSRYVNFHITEGSKITLLDEEGNKYIFRCAQTDRKGSFKYVGNFDAIIGKNIVKYRMDTFDGYVDFDIDKKKQGLISNYYLLLKSEIEKYFGGVANMDKIVDPNISDSDKLKELINEAMKIKFKNDSITVKL